MKHKLSRLFMAVALAVTLFGLAACGTDKTEMSSPDPIEAVDEYHANNPAPVVVAEPQQYEWNVGPGHDPSEAVDAYQASAPPRVVPAYEWNRTRTGDPIEAIDEFNGERVHY